MGAGRSKNAAKIGGATKAFQNFGLSPTRFLNQIKSGKFAKKIDWISDELFPEKAKQEKEPDEFGRNQILAGRNEISV